MGAKRIRVLIAKPGLDGHDRGAKIISRALRDAGMEVIYTGLRQTPEMIVEAALEEDVDVVGLSILSGAHMTLVPRILDLLHDQNLTHIRVFVGGIIPDADTAAPARGRRLWGLWPWNRDRRGGRSHSKRALPGAILICCHATD